MKDEYVSPGHSAPNKLVDKDHDKSHDEKSDANMSATNLRAIHEKSCKLVEMMDKQDIDEKLSKSCLLYTSPSPRDGLLSRMPSSA